MNSAHPKSRLTDDAPLLTLHFHSEREISAIDVWLSKGLSGVKGK